MKLRIFRNSLRLRLTKSEVAEIGAGGAIEEKIEFGAELSEQLIYVIETTTNAEKTTAVFDAGRITVLIPRAQAEEWARTNRVGIEAEKPLDDNRSLRILIEKDFSCLEPRKGEEDTDTFAHSFQNNQNKAETALK